jgi:TonB-linked SusC/RagA family outer membrane protein
MKRLILFIISIQIFTFAFAQQSFVLKGKVSSNDGELLTGVSVVVEGTTNGTMTGLEGEYELTVKPGDKVVFSFISFRKEVRTMRNQQTMDIVLMPDQTSLDEVVVVAYGKAKRLTMTGAVSAISAREIRNIPTSSVQNALYGKLPGFFAQQRSGQPGKDASDFYIRGVSSLNDGGNQPLIIVDDVQYTYDQMQQINVNEIESISLLKDASTTAIYGIKGANGVLVVRTRRGMEGKPQINVRLETGIQMPVRKPKFLNAYETAQLVNEAYENDGLYSQRPFNDEDLRLFQTGEDPYGHPDVNWYNEIFKNTAYQHNVNVDVSGGSQRLKYFVTGGMFSQNGLTRDFKDPTNEVNTNYFYRRFNYRTNLDFEVTKTLNLRLDMTSRFMNINEPHSYETTGQIYDFSKMRPYSAPVMNPDGSYAYHYGTKDLDPTLNARLANEGYRRIRRYDSNILFGATQKLDFITPGLSVAARIAYSSIDENQRRVFRGRGDYPTYHYDSASETYTLNPNSKYAYEPYTVLGDAEKSIKDLNIQAFANYETVIKEDHNLKAMFVYNRQSKTVDKDGLTSAAVPENFEGFTLTTNYNYKNKYLLDLNLAYNGTDRFEKDNRYGFFPAVGAGYSISEEPFFQERFPNVQLLKLRASIGMVGSDATPGNRYLYRQVYETGDGYNFGEKATSDTRWVSFKEGNLANPGVTWEKARKFDVGIDGNMFNKLSFTVDYFYDYRYDQLVERSSVPLIIGANLPRENLGKTENWGFDGQVGYQDRFGNVDFNTNFVFSFAKNKVIYKAEAQQKYPWLAETGRRIGQPFGYTWDGYYTKEDIDKIEAGGEHGIPLPNVAVKAGDLKYKDLNNDGIIDEFDKGPIGKPNLPSTTLGWTIGGHYKGFTLSVLLQGSFDYSFSIIGTGIESFKSQFQPIHQKRWTQERVDNGEKIEFPRLTTNPTTVSSSEAYMSDFWLVDAMYIRLKTVELSYQIPEKVLPKRMSNARLYMTAYNLFTWTNYNKYQQDPEIKTNSAGDAYMNQRVINFGVQVAF